MVAVVLVYASTRGAFSREVAVATVNLASLAFSCLCVASTLRLVAVRRPERHALPIAAGAALFGAALIGFGLHLFGTRLIANGYTFVLLSRVAPLLTVGVVTLSLSAVLRGVVGLVEEQRAGLEPRHERVGEPVGGVGGGVEEQRRLD
jgi:hypothetical protein